MTVEDFDNPPTPSTSTKDHFFGGVFLLLVVVSIIAVLYSTVSWMTDAERLPLSQVMVEGKLTHVKPSEVQQALSQIPHMGTFMTQDVDTLQAAVKTIPWVKQVSIRKQWPDLVKVYIVEYQAQAIWNGNSLLNDEGHVFNGTPADIEGNIVNLYGPDEESEKVLSVWKQSNKLLKPLGLNITSVVLNDRRAWQMILDNGIRLELGKDARDNRLHRFVQLYRRLGDKADQVSYIDLRYDTGAAVGWISDDDSAQESNK
ncbi:MULTISPECIES: cell division protein FtsQ/DivIB [Vibrio]|uniref:Cell division protein FtsQ n=1 Tax=Vibrio algicola TaxID=2662262 RepID=A0A5Q0TG39_9VIBR|nr:MULTISPECIES: cell division protein FtsQ/DivIB [Vibrio]MBD1576879.1 FtsQ-type POTRA domain-containing protein [Vibrio sp. S11_S32]